MSDTVTNVQYLMINNVLGRFISGFANYLRTEYFPRVEDTIISTYEKSIEYVRNRKNIAGEKWNIKYPFLVIDPQLEDEPSDSLGLFLYNYPRYDVRFAANMYKPRIYDDGDVFISPVLNRYKGNIEVILYCSSILEYIDYRVQTIQKCSGLNRNFYPKDFEAFLIIPEEFENYQYKNLYTQEERDLDWSGNITSNFIVRSIDKEKFIYPFKIRPMMKLTSISNGSEKYGGQGDIIGDHKMVFNFEYEVNIPVQIIMVANSFPVPKIPIEFVLATEVKTVENSVGDIISIAKEMDSVAHLGLDHTGQPEVKNLKFFRTYIYSFSEQDITDFNDDKITEITIPDGLEVSDERYLRLHGKFGFLDRDVHWRLKRDSTTVIEIMGFNLKSLEVNDYVTILIYVDDDYLPYSKPPFK